MATPLLLVLVVIELSDLVFAIDSIPAVFGVTQDPFIVYTSNMFAILVRRPPRPCSRVTCGGIHISSGPRLRQSVVNALISEAMSVDPRGHSEAALARPRRRCARSSPSLLGP